MGLHRTRPPHLPKAPPPAHAGRGPCHPSTAARPCLRQESPAGEEAKTGGSSPRLPSSRRAVSQDASSAQLAQSGILRSRTKSRKADMHALRCQGLSPVLRCKESIGQCRRPRFNFWSEDPQEGMAHTQYSASEFMI